MEHTGDDDDSQAPRITPREREMRKVLGQLDASGLTLREFGAQVGILPGTLGYWRHQIRRREAVRQRRDGQRAVVSAASTFVPVQVIGAGGVATDQGSSVEVVLRGDRRLHIRPGFDAATLARVVEVLERVPC